MTERARSALLPSLLGAAVAAVCAVLLLHHQLLFAPTLMLPGDVGDTRFNALILEHGYRWLAGLRPALWDVPMFFPATNTLAYSDVMLGVGAPYWAARVFGAPPDGAMAFWFVATTVTNAVVFHGFCRRVAHLCVPASSLASVLFAAGAAHANQLNHTQMLPMYFPVLALWGALRFVTEQSPWRRKAWLALLVGAVVAQLWGAFYVGWFLVLILFFALAVSLLHGKTRPLVARAVRSELLATAVAGIAALVALAPLGAHYLRAAREIGTRPWQSILLPRVQTWFNVGDSNWLWSFVHSSRLLQLEALPVEGEQRFGVGFITTAVMVGIACRWRKDAWVRAISLFTLGALATATLWRFGFAPWWLIYKLFPGGSAIRAVPRIGMFLLIPAALALALLVDRRPRGAAGFLSIAVAVGCVAEQWTGIAHFDAAAARANVAAIASAVPADCPAFFAVPRTERTDFEHHLDSAWASVELQKPTVNGYSGNTPPGWPFERLPARGDAESMLRRWTSKRVCLVDAP